MLTNKLSGPPCPPKKKQMELPQVTKTNAGYEVTGFKHTPHNNEFPYTGIVKTPEEYLHSPVVQRSGTGHEVVYWDSKGNAVHQFPEDREPKYSISNQLHKPKNKENTIEGIQTFGRMVFRGVVVSFLVFSIDPTKWVYGVCLGTAIGILSELKYFFKK